MFRPIQTPRPDYGLDAPGLGRGLFVAGALSAGLGLMVACTPRRRHSSQPLIVNDLLAAATYLLGLGCLMRYASKIGKLREREKKLLKDR